MFVWGACVSRAAAALKTLSPATVFIEGEGMHDQLKQADGLPASLSRIILVGASAAPAPAAAPPSAPAAPPSPMGAVQVLTWKNFLDGGDQLRGTCGVARYGHTNRTQYIRTQHTGTCTSGLTLRPRRAEQPLCGGAGRGRPSRGGAE